MKTKFTFSILVFAFFALTRSIPVRASDVGPEPLMEFKSYKGLLSVLRDTLPEVKKIPEAKTDSVSKASTIKEVPKSKKQVAPVAVNVQPIKIIKPKIIKPVIKIK